MASSQKQLTAAKLYRVTHSNLIDFECKICKSIIKIKAYLKNKYIKRGGVLCPACISMIRSNNLRALRQKQTPRERQDIARKAQTFVKDHSAATKKQWVTIKSNPEKFIILKKQRSEQGKENWESFNDEKKNRIITAMLASKGNVRSKICDSFKKDLVAKGINDFISEQPFHGFIPDEINHKLKIVIEMFGDLYHCNPEKYRDENQFIQVIGRTVGEQWQRDRVKIAVFARNGYKTIIVWEKNFRNDPKGTINEVIKKIEELKYALSKTAP